MLRLRSILVVAVFSSLCVASSSKVRSASKPGSSFNKTTQLPSRRPNIILILTDDQDVQLGSLEAMPRTLQHFRRSSNGFEFRNAYVTTPLCCPSRTSLLTGTYAHNHGVMSNEGECGSERWRQFYERRTFAALLKQRGGYTTAYFGKYLNQYDGNYVPFGWSSWTALQGNSRYYNYTLVSNAKRRGDRNATLYREYHGSRYETDYLTDLLANRTLAFIREHVQTSSASASPFLAVLSVPAPHGPETAAPKYASMFNNVTTHRTASFNAAPSADKQWLLASTSPMGPAAQRYTDLLHARRLETLQSVDEAVDRIITELSRLRVLDDTYVFYTSDNGYHLGQFGLVKGKFTPFEFDARVPLLVRAPSATGGPRSEPVLNVDLMPTMLDLAGVRAPSGIDGVSFARFLGVPVPSSKPRVRTPRAARNTRANVNNDKENGSQKKEWREAFLIERGNYESFNLSFSDLHFVDDPAVSRYSRKPDPRERQRKTPAGCDCSLFPEADKKQRNRRVGKTTPNPLTKRYASTGAATKRGISSQSTTKKRGDTAAAQSSARKASLKELLRPFVRDPSFAECLFRNVSSPKSRSAAPAINRTSVNRCIRVVSPKPKRAQIARLRNRLAAVSKSRLNSIIAQLIGETQRAYAGWKQVLKPQTRSPATRKRASLASANSASTRRVETTRRTTKGPLVTAATARRAVTSISMRAGNASLERGRSTRSLTTLRTASITRKATTKRGVLTTPRQTARIRSRRALDEREARRRVRNRPACARKCAAARRKDQRELEPCYQPEMSCVLVDTSLVQTQGYGVNNPASAKDSKFCFCSNSNNNSYACLRVLNERSNFAYCEFVTGFVSYFDLRRDPHQLNNTISKLTEPTRRKLHKLVGQLAQCAGKRCNSLRVRLGQPQPPGGTQSDSGAPRRVAVSSVKPTGSGSSRLRSTSSSISTSSLASQSRAARPGRRAQAQAQAQTKSAAQKRST